MTIGHNNPPEEINDAYTSAKQRVDKLVSAANEWVKSVDRIEDQETASACKGFLDQVKAEAKAVEKDRRDQKKPHEDAAKAVDAKFKPLGELLAAIDKALSPLMTQWLQLERERLAAEARKREEEALHKMQQAEEARKAAASIQTMVDAERIAAEADAEIKAADQAAKQKAAVKGDMGGRAAGLRQFWSAQIVDYDKALAHYARHPAIVEAVQSLANADARAQKTEITVPGVQAVCEERAV